MINTFLEDLANLDNSLNNKNSTSARVTLWDIELIMPSTAKSMQIDNKNILNLRKNPIDLLEEYAYYGNEHKIKRARNANLANLI